MSPQPMTIPARSQREVMDWGLVLTSQGIEATIEQTENGWSLAVEEIDYRRAIAVLELYQKENRGWGWRRELPGSSMLFHYGSVLWVSFILAFYSWSTGNPAIKGAGIANSDAIH